MILLYNSNELHKNKTRIPSSVYEFLVRQFALLEDEDPQMGAYGDSDFLCSTGTIGVMFDMDDLEGLEIMDEVILSDRVKIFTCMDEDVPMDVVLSPYVDNDEFVLLEDYRKLSVEEKESIRLIMSNYLRKYK